jgi:adenylate cyclase
MQRRLSAILAADMVGYSRLMGEDEPGTLARLRQLRGELVEPVIAAHGGRVVKLMGDGLLAEFSSIVEAVAAAVAIQRGMAGRETALAAESRLSLRIGIHLGDVMVDGDDIYGDGVNIAARLEGAAPPGGICISGQAHDAIEGKIALAFEDGGAEALKNIERPVRVFRLTAQMLAADAPAPAGRPRRRPTRQGRERWRVGMLSVALVLVVALAAAAVWNTGWFGAPPERGGRLSVAVLPFAAPGADAGEDWLGDGIAEDIMTAVARFRDLTVIARNSSFRFRGEAQDPREVGKALGADFLLQGTVRRSGDDLRVTTQLVDANDGATRWTERYDRTFADVFSIQEEIAESVATRLVVHAREAAVARLRTRPPERMEAYELALRGRKAYRQFSRDSAVEARQLAERAIAIDPHYAVAWEVLASALLQFYIQPYGPERGTPAMLAEARAAAARAVELDANFATGHATLGFVLLWAREHDAALAAVDKALELNPNDAVAHATRANILYFAGRYRESIEGWIRSEELDPFIGAINLALRAAPHIFLGEFEPALELSRACADRAPRQQPCRIYLAIAQHELGRTDEARATIEVLLDINPRFTISGFLPIVPFRDGTAIEHLGELLRRAGFPD